MTAVYAADIVTWRYSPPYDCYNMTSADPAFLADPANGFFALTYEGRLIGFRSFGRAAGQLAYLPDSRHSGDLARPRLSAVRRRRQGADTSEGLRTAR